MSVSIFYRPPGDGRLFDIKFVSSYVFLRTYYDWNKSKGKMLNMIILMREMFYFKKIIYFNYKSKKRLFQNMMHKKSQSCCSNIS